jgi:TP901 family phage tail tape measure protein
MAKSSEYELAIKIAGKVDSSLKSATKSAKGELGSLSATAKNAFKGIAVAGAAITSAAVAAGKALYDLGTEFDSEYDAIRIGTGATGDALEDLKSSMKDVYASVPTDMENAATAISGYNTRLGLTGDTLETLSAQALQVSDMLGDDLSGVIEASSQSFKIFDLDANQMADSMDWLFKVSQSTGIGFTELTSLVQSNGAAFQQMGFSYNESAAMLGKLEKAGYETSAVMTDMSYEVKASA